MTTPGISSQYIFTSQPSSGGPIYDSTSNVGSDGTQDLFRIVDLPLDIVHLIISYLQGDSPSLNNLSQIARAWNDLSTPYLYRFIDIRDPSMASQLRLQALLLSDRGDSAPEAKLPLPLLVQRLTLGICPPSHAHGDFIYTIPQILSKLENLKRLEIVKTSETSTYWNEGNSNSPLHRVARGETTSTLFTFLSHILPHPSPMPELTFLRIDIPIGPTLLSILNAQKPYLKVLELRHPQDRYSAEDLIPAGLEKLAICGDKMVAALGTLTFKGIKSTGGSDGRFEPTHLSLDHPSSTPLWPSHLRATKANYLSMPNTTHLRSLEISTSLVIELSLLINSFNPPIPFPSLVHFGLFTPRLAEARFKEERSFLMMWAGKKYDPEKDMVQLLRHFGGLESLVVQPEGVKDWMDRIPMDGGMLPTLRSICPGLKRVMWRKYEGTSAGAYHIREEAVIRVDMDDTDVSEHWKIV